MQIEGITIIWLQKGTHPRAATNNNNKIRRCMTSEKGAIIEDNDKQATDNLSELQKLFDSYNQYGLGGEVIITNNNGRQEFYARFGVVHKMNGRVMDEQAASEQGLPMPASVGPLPVNETVTAQLLNETRKIAQYMKDKMAQMDEHPQEMAIRYLSECLSKAIAMLRKTYDKDSVKRELGITDELYDMLSDN